ncbi:hypothetical protein QQ045_015254 [Rhodiola kirilowii]
MGVRFSPPHKHLTRELMRSRIVGIYRGHQDEWFASLTAVKALAWCPFQKQPTSISGGGGGGFRCIKFWNTNTGVCLNSLDAGSFE